jgi:hypothetical protein
MAPKNLNERAPTNRFCEDAATTVVQKHGKTYFEHIEATNELQLLFRDGTAVGSEDFAYKLSL